MRDNKIRKWIYLVMLTVMLLEGCHGSRKVPAAPGPAKLTESQQREYNYALTEATKQKLFGNYQQAAALYQKCIEVNPSSDAAYFQLSGIFMVGRNTDSAKKYNLKAVELNPENYWYKLQLSQLYLISQQPDSAAAIYEIIIKKWPDKVEVKFELARIYSELGKIKNAIEILDEVENEYGISEPVSMLKEQIYLREGKYEQAIAELNSLIELAPEEIRFLGILAELYTEIDRKDEAMKVYKKIFDIEPDNGIAQLSMAEFYRLDNNKGKQFEYLELAFLNESLPLDRKMAVIIEFLTDDKLFKENKKEIDHLLTLLEGMNPTDFRVKTARADYFTKLQKYDDAIKIYDDVLNEQKGNYFIWEQAIFIENILGNPDHVYSKCSEALEYFPDEPFLYLFKGNSAMQIGENSVAVKSLEKGLEMVENNIPLTVQFYSFLAEAWRNLDNYEKSDKYFDMALQMEPENIMILNNYGYYLALRNERLDEAEKMSKKTINLEPDNPTYLDTYAWILFKAGKLSEAKKFMERAINSGGSDDPDILEHYGDILNEQGNRDEARKYWIRAREFGSKSEDLEKKLLQ